MKNTVVLYQSKYGATKKYAEWLADDLGCEILETKSARLADIEKYDVIILGGGIYASGIAGLSFIKKNYSKLKDKKIAVFAVGASSYDEEAMLAVKERNFKDEIADVPCFYCRGAWNESIMSTKDKMLCSLLKKAVGKKDPATYQSWEKALMEAIGSTADWTDRKFLEPIIEFVYNE